MGYPWVGHFNKPNPLMGWVVKTWTHNPTQPAMGWVTHGFYPTHREAYLRERTIFSKNITMIYYKLNITSITIKDTL
jgi:hypothetical protein